MASLNRHEDVDSASSEKRAVSTGPVVDEAKLVRTIDRKVLPMLFVIYVAAFLDR